MLNVVYTELLKLKRTKILWLIIIGAGLPVLLLGFTEQSTWQDFFQNNLLFYYVMMSPPLLSLLSGYVVAREYNENTVNQLFVYPHHRITIMIGKTVTILLMLLSATALNFLFILLSGVIIGNQLITGILLQTYGNVYVWMVALQVLLIPITMTAGMVGKSYIPPIVLGIAAILINAIALIGIEDDNSGRIMFGSFLPFGSMIVHMMVMIEKANLDNAIYIHPLYIHGVTFLLFFIFNAIYYTRSEVHSGS
jgi:bacitracin transport system permease protein